MSRIILIKIKLHFAQQLLPRVIAMSFQEVHAFRDPISLKPIRELNLQIGGTPLEASLRAFDMELDQRGFT